MSENVTPTPPEPTYLTAAEVCAMLRISRQTLWVWRRQGLPSHSPGGRRLLFDRAEVVTWVSQCACTSPSAGEAA